MENRCLERDDFFIGREFLTETGRWRCTDVGTRTICAISLEPQDVISVHPVCVQTRAKSNDASWLDGPPYVLVEHVFDECSFGALYSIGANTCDS